MTCTPSGSRRHVLHQVHDDVYPIGITTLYPIGFTMTCTPSGSRRHVLHQVHDDVYPIGFTMTCTPSGSRRHVLHQVHDDVYPIGITTLYPIGFTTTLYPIGFTAKFLFLHISVLMACRVFHSDKNCNEKGWLLYLCSERLTSLDSLSLLLLTLIMEL
ncbi:hypothetical protein J6590_013055 [Homalodisca vitripennis]|nr:hypothetical protein J6590_013055 [Homalodisca vitripennis]